MANDLVVVKSEIQPVDDLVPIIRDDLERLAAAAELADFAIMMLREVLADINADPAYQVVVDGRRGGQLDRVRPGGEIVFEFDIFADVLTWIGEELRRRSPVRSGAYRDGHMLFADGQPIDIGGPYPPAKEYAFTNPLPYSYKLEIGKTESGRDFLVSVPNRIYERVADDALARFGNSASIEYSTRGVVDGLQVNQDLAGSSGRFRRGGVGARAARGSIARGIALGAHNKSDVRFPTIIVKTRG